MKIDFHRYKDIDFKDPVAIIGFPSIGLVSSIAASFLARGLGLGLVGGMSSDGFPPYAVVQGGVPLPPIRVYAAARCNDDDGGIDCDGLIVITSEVVPKPEQQHPLAVYILEWLRGHNVKKVINLEGIPQYGLDETVLLGVGSSDYARGLMDRYGVDLLTDGMVRGMSGIMLFKAPDYGVDVMTLLITASTELPDPRAAAKLMEPLARILPEISVDTEPLYREAEEIDKRMRTQIEDRRDDERIYG